MKNKKESKKADDEEELELDFDSVFEYVKTHKFVITIIGIILALGVTWIVRTQDIPNFVGGILPDLDTYVFLRYANDIITKGAIPLNDTMRYYPTGFDTTSELMTPSYAIAAIYRILNLFTNVSVNDAAILFPVITTCIGMIFFFLIAHDAFGNAVAVISSLLLAVSQGFLYRTSAGVPEKEPIAIMFLFPMIYFILKAIRNTDLKKKIIYSLLCGVCIIGSAASWGGSNFTFIPLEITLFLLVMFGVSTRKDSIVYFILVLSILGITLVSGRYGVFLDIFKNYMFILFVPALFLNLFVHELYPKLNSFVSKYKPSFLSEQFYSVLLGIFILFILTLIYPGISYYSYLFKFAFERINNPFGSDPFALSVSENQAPYFYDPSSHVDWWSPLNYTFFTMLLGSFLLFYELLKEFKHSRLILTITYVASIVLFIFARFSSDSKYAWINNIMDQPFLGLQLHHWVLFSFFAYFAFFTFKNNKRVEAFKKFRPEYLFLFLWFLLSAIGASGGVRLIFAVCPPAMILSGYFFRKLFDIINRFVESKTLASSAYVLAIILIGYNLFVSINLNKNIYPSFTSEWNDAMNWVKLNTPIDSVFAHWWDYGYWVQTMGDRATNLDGGNFFVDRDHLMGRYLFASRVFNNGTYNMSEPATALVRNFGSPEYFLIIDDDVLKYVQMGRIGKRPMYYTVGIPDQTMTNDVRFNIANASTYPSIAVYKSIYGAFPVQEDFKYNNFLYKAGQTYIVNILFPYNETDVSPKAYAAVYNSYADSANVKLVPFNCYCTYGEQCYYYRNDGLPECTYLVSDGVVLIPQNASNNLFTQLYLLNATVPGFEIAYDNDRLLNIQGMVSQSLTDIKIYKINYTALDPFVLDSVPNYWTTTGGVFW
ncbi:Oligosaccharyl transferase STT3 subunit [Candidatus Tiddalikarchaeum anstoanum]|nr:Oligosaccharyl transferase STT3 subunit [Candidatus Tiddalikarchaeum anstoanum]